jgi:hypothetical protein
MTRRSAAYSSHAIVRRPCAEECERSARPQDPSDLREGGARIEVVERIAHDDRMSRLGAERHRFGRRADHPHAGHALLEHLAHVPRWLDRDDLSAESREPR